MAFGHVHCDVRDVARAEEGERPVAMPGVEPLWLAELDSDLEAEHALLALLDIREGTRRRQKPGWELKEDRGQLAGGAQRLQGASEPLPTLIDDVLREVLHVQGLLFAQICPQVLPDVGRQRERPGRVVGEQRERLHIEGEAGRRLGRPAFDGLRLRDTVLRGVYLTRREL